MTVLSRLGRQITEVVALFNGMGVPFALIGGLALAAHKVVRATQDVDLLTEGRHADAIDKALAKIGYQCLHRSMDAGNYLRGDERLDLLYATRPAALALLAGAPQVDTAFGALHVVSAEGLIAFKLQGWVNNPRRGQDLQDIRALVRANRDRLNLAELRGYFALFKQGSLLDELLNESTAP
jgi:hypothetical protein